ncbi:uncharacterized protein LOC143915858 [Arctopsyche grandis]|uniref:uncharacterized protein LOC143915858 n=1 Tax=Arctopsyche grandis TaxID=121162 RepID=UPI00406D73C3
MEALIALKKARKGIRAKLTRNANLLGDNVSLIELKARFEMIKPLLSEFESVQDQIDELDQEEAQASESVVDIFDREYMAAIVRYTEAINLREPQFNVPPLDVVTSAVTPVPQSPIPQSNTAIKLPQLELPTFEGNIQNWRQFAQRFLAAMAGENSQIARFQYLLAVLKGEPSRVVSGLELADDAFSRAWSILDQRYNNKKIVIQHHLQALFEAEPVASNHHVSLRRLIDDANMHVRALVNLGVRVETWNEILVMFITRKLDRHTLQQWELQAPKYEDCTFVNMMDFLTGQCQAVANADFVLKGESNAQPRVVSGQKAAALHVGGEHPSCINCSGSHSLLACTSFRRMSGDERRAAAIKHRLCLNCLRPGHMVQACRTKQRCVRCGRAHHTLLHDATACQASPSNKVKTSQSPQNSKYVKPVEPSAVLHSVRHATPSHSRTVLLCTVEVQARGRDGQLHKVRALLDNGSEVNIMSEDLRRRLALKSKKMDVNLLGVGLNRTSISYGAVVRILPRLPNQGAGMDIDCAIMSDITHQLPSRNVSEIRSHLPLHLPLADPSFDSPGTVDMVMGSDIYHAILRNGRRTISIPSRGDRQGSITMLNTAYGWILGGSIAAPASSNNARSCNLSLMRSIRAFWELEEPNTSKVGLDEGHPAEQSFIHGTTRDSSGRFMVRLPFKADSHLLGDSRTAAEKRFRALKGRFARNEQFRNRYEAFLQEFIDLGHMSECNSESVPNFYLPHHAVSKESSLTTKLRVVFDGSAKSSSGTSLNDVLHVGPRVQDDIFDILLRFRQHSVAVTADIEKMYRQIRVHPDDQPFQRIIWGLGKGARTYQLNTVTYGTACASFLATRCLRALADEHRAEFPEASTVLSRDFYVDDLLSGASSVQELTKLAEQINYILARAGLPLRKWASNTTEPISIIPASDQGTDHCHVISKDETSTLGLNWHTKCDTFAFPINLNTNAQFTKRNILAQIARLFDPLGLLGPTIVLAKQLMQELFRGGLNWDEAIPERLASQWEIFISQLPKLRDIMIPRHVLLPNPVSITLLGFCDASQKAYGACIYALSTDRLGHRVCRLFCAKSRVAPLKTLTIPRLELCGAHLLHTLVERVRVAITVPIDEVILWTDSTIVLAWLKGESSRWTTFVSHRVAKIQSMSGKHSWNHISSQDNPADSLSRGFMPSELQTMSLWWNGPKWILQDRNTWPKSQVPIEEPQIEAKGTRVALVASTSDWELLSRYSSWHTLTRITAYCLRFIAALRRRGSISGPLSRTELIAAETKIIKHVQSRFYKREIALLESALPIPNNRLKALRPFLDPEGALRVGGRLSHTHWQFERKHPLIVPAKAHITELLVRAAHEQLLHAGTQLVSAHLRERYWLIGGRNTVSREIRRCVRCSRVIPRLQQPIMGDLPALRTAPARPFLNCGVDYAGPILIKEKASRNRSFLKAYICIFVCLATKAVHLEVVQSLTSRAFIDALKRFISRRGLVAEIWSDNATNFIGTDRMLTKLLASTAHKQSLHSFCSEKGMNWRFIPPRAPHFGGLWEAAVKSMKRHLKRVMGSTTVTYESLNTLITQIEAVLNSRPLTPLSSDPSDLIPLTPGHFLVGGPLIALPQEDLVDQPLARVSTYKHLQQMLQHFWKRWAREYVTLLQQRHKSGSRESPNLQPGDMVIVAEENAPPLEWPMGRILAVHPGHDGVVRVITIRTVKGVIKRAARRVARLPVEQHSVNLCNGVASVHNVPH